MSSHHDHDNHSAEPKEVSFRTPMILAFVTVLIILLAVSTCDKGHHGSCECKEDCSEECMKKCESGDHSEHGATTEHSTETHEVAPATEEHAAVADTTAAVAHDTTAVAPAKVEEHAHH